MVLPFNYNAAAYPVQLDTREQEPGSPELSTAVPSLVDSCCQKIVQDASSTKAAMENVPTELGYSLMKAAVHGARDRAIEILISNWPWDTLALQKFAPPLFDDIKVLYSVCYDSDSYVNERICKGVKYTTCLARTFVECLQKRAPTKLKCLDLSGYPAAEVIVNYMSSYVLLVYNRARQKEIINANNAVTKDLPEEKQTQFQLDCTLPDETYVVTMDAFLQTTDTYLELCKALIISNQPQCPFKLCLNKLDIMNLDYESGIWRGIWRTTKLLEQVDPQYLTALCLQDNDLWNDALTILVPGIVRLQHLTALDLSWNSINLGPVGSEVQATNQMAELLSGLPNLVRLDLSYNQTENKLRTILQGTSKPLEYLKLRRCGMSESDILYLQSSHHVKSLTELDISGNDISRSFNHVLTLLSSLSLNLRVLEMEKCDIDTPCISQFFHSFPKYECLQYLNLSRNEPWAACVLDDALLALVQNLTLQAVKVSYPAECYSVLNPDFIEEDIIDYTQGITDRLETHCKRIGRSLLKLVFVPWGSLRYSMGHGIP